jgi:hypothetical protein
MRRAPAETQRSSASPSIASMETDTDFVLYSIGLALVVALVAFV